MNYLFCGKSCDLNIGNGKTVSAVRTILREHLINGKKIFSNIKLIGVDYVELKPGNIHEVFEYENVVVLFDELHAIIDIHHKVSPTCTRHSTQGLCYEVSEFFRQVRKRNITTLSTVQSFSDCVYRLKVVMQEIIVCEKFHVENGIVMKCKTDTCPKEHGNHYIKQTNIRTGEELYFEPEPFYNTYDSSEIVKGWTEDSCKPKK